ncbi:MAG: hypothetical protein D3924_02170 [Candidatus Electrothrix sp. AR4]|nr:hypothetical protein [Candidatus Electrothrix sp. AR4]
MEIADPIFFALRQEIENCRQKNKERLAVLDPILLGIEAVTMHIDVMRAASDARAFNLLNELIEACRLIFEEFPEQEEAQVAASTALKKVLDWQHNCMVTAAKTKKNLEAAQVSESDFESASMDMDALLATVQQEIAATGMMAVRESGALLELMHVQKETAETPSDDPVEDVGFSSLVRENISSLQLTLHQEMGRLRHELGQD